jgi:hypothetical protein
MVESTNVKARFNPALSSVMAGPTVGLISRDKPSLSLMTIAAGTVFIGRHPLCRFAVLA